MAIVINKLNWDSDFFGYPVGRIIVQGQDFDQLFMIKEAAKTFKLVYVFSDGKIEIDGFKQVDTKLIFEKEILKPPVKTKDVDISYKIESFETAKHNFEQLRKLALQSGIFSRFFIDKEFKNGEYNKLYNEWLTKSINKTLAFETLVAIEADKISGFMTLSEADKTTAEIGLIAIDICARGKGIAMELIRKGSSIVSKKGYKQFLVATQKSNQPAIHLYKKAGFREISSQHIYHIWNHDTL